jgi:hypothetical protein
MNQEQIRLTASRTGTTDWKKVGPYLTARNCKEMPDAKFSDWVRAEDIAQTIAFFCEGPGCSLRDEVVKVYNNA